MNIITLLFITLTLVTNPLKGMLDCSYSEPTPEYSLYRATELYTIFEQKNYDLTEYLPYIISFKSLTKENKPAVFVDAWENPNNNFLNLEFEHYKKRLHLVGKEGQGKFLRAICRQQAIKVIEQKRGETPSSYLWREELRRFIASKKLTQNKPLPNPLIIEHIKFTNEQRKRRTIKK